MPRDVLPESRIHPARRSRAWARRSSPRWGRGRRERDRRRDEV